MKIWKYQMKNRECHLEIPKGAYILSCQMQNDFLYFWCLLDENQTELESRHFVGVGTGYDVPFPVDRLDFIDTVQSDNDLVHHIFEVHGLEEPDNEEET